MAVYYKFKSAKDFDSIAIDGHFISVAILKERIFESKHLGRGTDFDLVVTNAQTNEEYLDEATMIPKNTSVLIRRVPGRPRMPIVTQPDEPKVESTAEDEQPPKSNFVTTESSAMNDFGPSEWDDDFGHDLYATIPEATLVQAGNSVQDALPPNKADEDSKIKALIETPALDWQRQGADGYGPGRGFARGGRMMPGCGFGRGVMERKTPPPGYVCHRCKIPGHYIQHCPTNGDPNYDIRRMKPPTGIPRSMLIANPDGSYALPSGAVAVLKPNEAAFEKEIEGLPSIRSVGELPPELHCPLCREVMKDAVLTSKCCFESFCDKCIRDYIISNSKCVCGATDVLADDLLPNKTLRDAINRILESNTGSAENAGSFIEVQDMESARGPQPRHPSPSQSAASKGEQLPPSRVEEVSKSEKIANEEKPFGSPQQQLLHQATEKGKAPRIPDVSEATHESVSVKEPASQGSALLADEEVQQRSAAVDAGKKKKKKKARLPLNGADMQWRNPQDLAAENYMMSMGPSPYNPYWGGMQPPMDPYMAPFPGPMPYNMGYNVGPMDMPPFGGMIPPDPFGAPGFMYPPFPPQRDLAELVPGFNARPPLMSREEFEARKADLRRKREMERRAESREMPRDRDPPGREMSRMSGDAAPMRPISNPGHREPSQDRYDRDIDRSHHRDDHDSDRNHDHNRHRSSHHRPERASVERSTRDSDLPHPPSKRKSDHNTHSHEEERERAHGYDQDRHHEKERERDHDRESERDRKRDRDRERVHDKERDHDRERDRRRHHRRSESSIKASPPAAELPNAPSQSSSAAAAAAAEERKHKASVFSRISWAEEPNKKRKVSSSSSMELKASSKEHDAGVGGSSSSHHRRSTAATIIAASDGYQEESSDDDRHFKRRPSRYEPSPPPRHKEWEEEEEVRHSRSSRERERERGSHGSKHR